MNKPSPHTFKHHILAVKTLGDILRRVRIGFSCIISLISFPGWACGKLLRIVMNARYNSRLYFYKPSLGREITGDLPCNAHFLPPRLPSPGLGYFLHLQTRMFLMRHRPPGASSTVRPGLSRPRELSPLAREGKPKIMLFSGTLGPGGTEKQICLLARELRRRGCPVHVVLSDTMGASGHWLPWLREEGIPCLSLHTHLSFFLLPAAPLPHQAEILAQMSRYARKDCLALCAHLTLDPPDVLHCFLDSANIIGAYAGLLSGVPALRLSARSMNPNTYLFYQDWWRPSYQYLLKYPRVALEANSGFAACDYQEWLALPSRPEVIPNAVDTAPFERLPDDVRERTRQSLGLDVATPLVLAVLRLSEEKCPFDMLSAFAELRRRQPTARLIHVGIGPLREEAERQAQALLLEDSVLFLGERHDVPALMAAADALLLTSRIESCPNVLLEAMAAGLPFIAPRVGGVPELAEEGENGFLVEHGDVAAMADRLALLLDKPELARSMGGKGKARLAARYTTERLAANVLAAYGRQFAALGHTTSDK